MWQQDGARQYFARPHLRPVLRLASWFMRCAAGRLSGRSSRKPGSSQSGKSAPSGEYRPLTLTPTPIASARVPRLLTWLAVLSTMALQGCLTGWSGQQRQTQAPECPLVQCLDRVFEPTKLKGVLGDPAPVRTCADAVVLAADSLATLTVERSLRDELAQCVRDFNNHVQTELNRAAPDR